MTTFVQCEEFTDDGYGPQCARAARVRVERDGEATLVCGPHARLLLASGWTGERL